MTLIERLKDWARTLKNDVLALWIAARSPETPLIAKMAAGAVAAYALSPIDLIPDFIPILGYLDDILIVPLGITLAVRLIPPVMMEAYRAQAMVKADRPRSVFAAILIVTLWVLGSTVAASWLWTCPG